MRDDYLKDALKVIPDANLLINVVSRRVKQLRRGSRPLVESLEKLSSEDTALREIARFDDMGLWSQEDIWFSRFGTLLATAERFVNHSPRGYFADELARALHVQVQDALHQLTQQRRVTREMVSGLYLYTATDRAVQRGQLLTRRTVQAVPTVADASVLDVSQEELKASILLFYSLLNEQQRRLYAGLESLKLGRGGDRQRRIASGLVHARQPNAEHAISAAQSGRQQEAPDRGLQPGGDPLVARPLLCFAQAPLPPGVPAIREVARQVFTHEVAACRQLAEQTSARIGGKRWHGLPSHAPTGIGSPARRPVQTGS